MNGLKFGTVFSNCNFQRQIIIVYFSEARSCMQGRSQTFQNEGATKGDQEL